MISHSLNNTFQSNLKHELILDVYKNFVKLFKNNYCWNKDKGLLIILLQTYLKITFK